MGALLFCAIFLFLSPRGCFRTEEARAAYLPLTPNADLSIAGPYDTAASGTANWGVTTGSAITSRDFLTDGQRYRIRQTGSIVRLRLYAAQQLDLTGFYLKIWRKDGTTYDLVGTSENLISQFTYGDFVTVNLTTPLAVQEGDYYGYRMENNNLGGWYFYARTGIAGAKSYYVNNVVPGAADYDWGSQLSANGAVLPIELYMQSPQVAFIGDSIIAGHPAHYDFLETTTTTNIPSTIERQFANLTGYVYQNMGIGSQTTTQIAARFANDVIGLHPRAVVMDGGVNDIAGGSITKTTFLTNWTSMLNACRDNDIIPIVIPILPWTNGTTAQMTTRDDWNASLLALAETYEDAIVVDMSSAVGQFAADGPEGNLWDIKTAYNADGVHFNTAGHGVIAAALAAVLEESTAHLTVTGAAAQTAGTSQTVTLRAINNFGDVHAAYTGDKTITLSGAAVGGDHAPTFTDKDGAEVDFGSSGTVTFANGVATTAIKLYKAESVELEATDGTYATSGSGSYDLNVAVSAAALGSFSAASPASIISGTPFALTVTAKDIYGNTATAVSSPVSLSVDYGTLDVSSLAAANFTDDGAYTRNVTLSGVSQDRTVTLTMASGGVSSTASLAVIGVSAIAFVAPSKPDVSNIEIISSADGTVSVANLPDNVREIAISRSPDFGSVSWQTFDSEKFKTIGDISEILYVKFRTDKGAVSEVVVLEPRGGNSQDIVLNEGDIVKSPDNPDVYIIKYKNGKQFKRLILSPSVFSSYGHLKWERLKTVSRARLDGFTASELVQVAGDSDIYRLTASDDAGTRRVVSASENIDPDSVYEINQMDRNSYALVD